MKMNENRRILIVDDEPYNQLGLKIMLRQAGFSQIEEFIDEANNGHEAFEKVEEAFQSKKFSYGLIFMDFSMPIMDGFQATDKIRRFIRHNFLMQPKIIGCTGHTEEAYILKAWRYQIDEVIPKPANLPVIKQLLNEMIELDS